MTDVGARQEDVLSSESGWGGVGELGRVTPKNEIKASRVMRRENRARNMDGDQAGRIRIFFSFRSFFLRVLPKDSSRVQRLGAPFPGSGSVGG